jgi:hypothetical protein
MQVQLLQNARGQLLAIKLRQAAIVRLFRVYGP